MNKTIEKVFTALAYVVAKGIICMWIFLLYSVI